MGLKQVACGIALGLHVEIGGLAFDDVAEVIIEMRHLRHFRVVALTGFEIVVECRRQIPALAIDH